MQLTNQGVKEAHESFGDTFSFESNWVPKLVKGRGVVTGIKCKTHEANKRRVCDYNPSFTYFMNISNRFYEFQITN
jgi:hypothetical protein